MLLTIAADFVNLSRARTPRIAAQFLWINEVKWAYCSPLRYHFDNRIAVNPAYYNRRGATAKPARRHPFMLDLRRGFVARSRIQAIRPECVNSN